MLPDDYWVGEMLADMLITAARVRPDLQHDGKIGILGLTGAKSSSAAILRGEGLEASVARHADADLLQLVPITDWSRADAQERFVLLQSRYPEAAVVWTANTDIANGAIDGMASVGLTPGKDLLVGSVNIDNPVLERIQAGEVVGTIGGNVLQGAFVVVMLYDYFHGIDFAQEAMRFQAPMTAVTRENLNVFLGKFTPENLAPDKVARIDFTRYSKALNPDVSTYDFNVKSVFAQF